MESRNSFPNLTRKYRCMKNGASTVSVAMFDYFIEHPKSLFIQKKKTYFICGPGISSILPAEKYLVLVFGLISVLRPFSTF